MLPQFGITFLDRALGQEASIIVKTLAISVLSILNIS